jgi:hypothetical protein
VCPQKQTSTHLQGHDVIAIAALVQHPLPKLVHAGALLAQAGDAGLVLVGAHLQGVGRR